MFQSESLNMSSALLHVLSDCLRSTTTLIESILIFVYPATPSYIFDGYATFIVTLSILVGGLAGVFKWVCELRSWMAKSKASLGTEMVRRVPVILAIARAQLRCTLQGGIYSEAPSV